MFIEWIIFARHEGPYIVQSSTAAKGQTGGQTGGESNGCWGGFKAGAFSFFMKRAQMEGAEASPGGAMWSLC